MRWVRLLPFLDLVRNPIIFFSLFLNSTAPVPVIPSLVQISSSPIINPQSKEKKKGWWDQKIYADLSSSRQAQPRLPTKARTILHALTNLRYTIYPFSPPQFLNYHMWNLSSTCTCLNGDKLSSYRLSNHRSRGHLIPQSPISHTYDWSLHMASFRVSRPYSFELLSQSRTGSELSSHPLWFLSSVVAQEGRNLWSHHRSGEVQEHNYIEQATNRCCLNRSTWILNGNSGIIITIVIASTFPSPFLGHEFSVLSWNFPKRTHLYLKVSGASCIFNFRIVIIAPYDSSRRSHAYI